MSIVSSVIAKDISLGYARYIEEKHTDNFGVVHVVRYQCPVGFDANARLATRALEINELLAQQEVTEVTG